MTTGPSVLIVTTQTWLQATRLAVRLGAHGCRISVLCPQESPLAFLEGIAQQFRFNLLNPLRSLRSAIATSNAEYLLPTDDLSVWLLHDLIAVDPMLRTLVERSIGNPEFYPVLRSRFRLLSLARQLGIKVPRTELIRDVPDMQSWCRDGNAPFVLKKDGTWGGQGVQVVRTAEEAHDAFHLLARPHGLGARAAEWLRNGDGSAFARLRCLRQPEMTAQAFVQGVPANAMYACYEGRILGEVQARVAATRGKTGPSIVIQLMNDSRIRQAGARIAKALSLSGFFGLDFILDEATGEPVLLECNPRATQLGHLTVAGQPELAGLLWASWTNQPIPPGGDAGLSNIIWFYPDGRRLTEHSARFPDCRADAPPEEMEVLERRRREAAPAPVRSRRAVWKLLSRLKGSLTANDKPQPFYYPNLIARSPESEQAGTAGGARASVVFIAR